MASQAQIEANRKNAQKSTGPKSPGGKAKTRFNGVKHGLRAEQVVLPGERADEFEAERKAWFDDWKPGSHTRAVLIERAASASWRLRRSVRVETARLRKLANGAANLFDANQTALIDRAMQELHDDPGSALGRLRSDAAGLDHLIGLWDELGRAAADPGGWVFMDAHHDRFLALLGYPTGSEMDGDEPVLLESYYLLLANTPGADFGEQEPLTPEDMEDSAAEVRAVIDRERAALRVEREGYWDPSVQRSRAIDAACVDTSKEAVLHHRYEMAHDRSLRATIHQLMALHRSGADLMEEDEEDASAAQVPAAPTVAAPTPGAPTGPNPPSADAPTGPNPGTSEGPSAPTGPNPTADPAPPTPSDRDRSGRTPPVPVDSAA